MSDKTTDSPNGKRPHILWTRAETLQLEKLIGERWPVKKIAARLRKSEKAVRKKCEWLGISSSTTYRRAMKLLPPPPGEIRGRRRTDAHRDG